MREKLVKLFKQLPSNIDPNSAINAVENIMHYNAEIKKSGLEIKKLDFRKEVLLKDIELKYDLYHKVFTTIFAERRETIDKFFEIIDMGLKEKNNDLINSALVNLGQLVSSSPFANISELGAILNNRGKIEL